MANTQKIYSLQKKLYQLSKQREEYRFYSLYDKTYRMDILRESYKRCKANRGSPGVDKIDFQDIEKQGLEEWLLDISEKLRTKTYKPKATNEVKIPKPGGKKTRKLGIGCISDRVVEGAIKMVIEPILEAKFDPRVYGYRPKRSASDAVDMVIKGLSRGYCHVFDADMKAYFDTIPHDTLMDKLRRYITDKNILSLILKFLRSATKKTDDKGRVTFQKNKIGVKQGSVLSAVLANLYLNDFIKLINNRTPCICISYADDFLIMSKEEYSEKQITWFGEKLEKMGLTLDKEKTSTIDMNNRKEILNFLGYKIQKQKSRYKGGKDYFRVEPGDKSIKRVKDKMRDIVKHKTSLKLSQLIDIMNPIIKGWRNYFNRIGYPKRTFFKLDLFMNGRFYRWSRRLSQTPCKYFRLNMMEKLSRHGLKTFQRG